MEEELLGILDAGSQFGKVIDRKVRELKVKSEIVPFNSSLDDLKKYKALIISGGPESVYSPTAPKYDESLFSSGIPILGICYGFQLINHVFGGKVQAKEGFRQDGQSIINVCVDSKLFKGMQPTQKVLLTHGDSVDKEGIADPLTVISHSGGIVTGFENEEKAIYGLQFHPEVDLTENGKQILSNFLFGVASFTGDYTIEDREVLAIKEIQEILGEDKKALVLVSGGVDSSVCAALLSKAIAKERIYAIHVDHGLMRLNESQSVKSALENIGLNLKVVNAAEQFANSCLEGDDIPLCETINPESKRNIIGDTFMRVAEAEIKAFGLNPDEVILAQGTLRPDLIESASNLASKSGTADKIKTHHNDTNLVRELRNKGRVIEPLKDYHKDEVRVLGALLGLPDELVWRQPFPGPGLAVRILCCSSPHIEDDFEDINLFIHHLLNYNKFETQPDNIIEKINHSINDCFHEPELQKEVLKSISSIHGVVLPILSVGVQGDGRTYSNVVGLSGERNWDQLFWLAKTIPKMIHKVNRVVYIFGDAVCSSITSVTPTLMSPDVIHQLQLADHVVNQVLYKRNLVKKISQVPVILVPLPFDEEGNRSIVIRTMITNDFMTGVPAEPGKDIDEDALDEMVSGILQIEGISRVMYDLTSKPPGTTEWE